MYLTRGEHANHYITPLDLKYQYRSKINVDIALSQNDAFLD